ncbi:actin-10 [Trichonephila clavipes]|uniref:Actin-10 n=1 Tax=Trichonephila clavipes TaxID=2585209 RepID=A0A8X6W7T1_TRICX|nr:actin-10 [Trichonephila clavipes]
MERTKTSPGSYSSQRVDNESKTNSFPSSKFSFSTEARDSSKISFECTSSLNDTNILDGSRTLDANEELLETRNEHSSSPHFSTENTTHSLSNTCHDENISNREDRTNGFEKSSNMITLFQHKGADENKYENHGVKKFITSSWNLATIVESLYFLPGPELPEVTPSEANFKKDFFVMSRGAFCKYPEGNYTLELQHPYVIISQETNVLMSIFLKYADFSDDGNLLSLDNKLGRCLYIQCSTREELLELKQELQKHRSKCYTLKRIHLVHYPLKCHRRCLTRWYSIIIPSSVRCHCSFETLWHVEGLMYVEAQSSQVGIVWEARSCLDLVT